MKDPVRISVANKYQTVDQLEQEYIFFPSKYKDAYLAHILDQR